MKIKLTKAVAVILAVSTMLALFSACENVNIDVDNSGDVSIGATVGIGSGTTNGGSAGGSSDGSESTPTVFTVQFLDADGNLLKKMDVNKGGAATPPPNPVLEGHVFIGWDADYSSVNSNLIIKPKFAKKDYTNCEHSLACTEAKAATCTEGGNREYWYCGKCKTYFTEENAITRIEKSNTLVAPKGHDVVIDNVVHPTHEKTGLTEGSHCSVCKIVLVEQTVIPVLGSDCYYIVYKNGSYTDENDVKQRCDFSLPEIAWEETIYEKIEGKDLPAPKITGYEFLGWYTAWDGGEEVVTIEPGSEGNYVLYAHWALVSYDITYSLMAQDESKAYPSEINNPNPDTDASSAFKCTVNIKDEAFPLAALTRSGYDEFLGWYTNAALTSPANASWFENWKNNPSNVTIYPKWQLAEYYNITKETDNYIGRWFTPTSSTVVLDFSDTQNGVFNIPSYNSGTLCSSFDICAGVKEVYFLGNANTTYKNTYICMATNTYDHKLTVHLDDFNYQGYMFPYEIDDAHLVIDVIGNCSVKSTSGAALLNFKNLTITGSGNLILNGADGADATAEGGRGEKGSAAISVTNLVVDMTGSLTATGGSGGNGMKGKDGNPGKPGDRGLDVSEGRHGGDGERGGDGYDGDPGEKGGDGGNGACAVVAGSLKISAGSSVKLVGGNGGKGGIGGNGGDGGKGGKGGDDDCQCIECFFTGNEPGNGGNGGNGGDSGDGGDGGQGAYAVSSSCNIKDGSDANITKTDGSGGQGGDPGEEFGKAGGAGGGGNPGNSGAWGQDGTNPGNHGKPGDPGKTPTALVG